MVPQNSVGGGQQVTTVQAPTPQRPPVTEQDMVDDQPLYVNAKQYHRILKRRQQRAKLEAQGKIPKERRVGLSSFIIVTKIVKNSLYCSETFTPP